MLARNFMTPIELGLSEPQHAALVTVLYMLERGDIRHAPLPRFSHRVLGDREPTTFNMASWHCGTACCLGGWAEHVGKLTFDEIAEGTGLDRLFWPDSNEDTELENRDLLTITTAQAAAALRSFLVTGEPNWPAAMVE